MAIDGFAVLTWQPFDYEAVYKTDYCYNKGVFVIFLMWDMMWIVTSLLPAASIVEAIMILLLHSI